MSDATDHGGDSPDPSPTYGGYRPQRGPLTERQLTVIQTLARRYHHDRIYWHKTSHLARLTGYTSAQLKHDMVVLHERGVVTDWNGEQSHGTTWGLTGVGRDV